LVSFSDLEQAELALMTVEIRMKKAFKQQKGRARQRGVAFEMSFDQWREFWTIDDRWSRRGTGADNLVMSRIGDKGAYVVGNVICQTQRENGLESARKIQSA
jgi:hypothetical protein